MTIYGSRQGKIVGEDRNGVGARWYTIEYDDGTREWLYEDKVKFIPRISER